MSVVSPTWLSLSGEANYLRSTYIDGFLDVSSSRGVLLRSDVSFGQRLIMTSPVTSVSPNSTAAASATYSTSTNSTSSWSNNGVTWSSAVSSGSFILGADIRSPEKAFNNTVTGQNGWLMSNNSSTPLNRYTGAGSTYAGTATQTTLQNSVGTTNGEWLQINSSVPIIMKDYQLYSGDNTTLPKTYFIAGSSDNSTWYPIIKVVMTTNPSTIFTGVGAITIPSGTTASTTTTGLTYNYTYTTYGNGTTAYQYFRIITTQVSGTSSHGVDISEWNINFTPTTSAITLVPSTTAYGQLVLTGGLTTTQNVGIGTNNPTSTLHVAGNITGSQFNLYSGESRMSGDWVNLGIFGGQSSRMSGLIIGHMISGGGTGGVVIFVYTAVGYHSGGSFIVNNTGGVMTNNLSISHAGGISVIGTNGHILRWSYIPIGA